MQTFEALVSALQNSVPSKEISGSSSSSPSTLSLIIDLPKPFLSSYFSFSLFIIVSDTPSKENTFTFSFRLCFKAQRILKMNVRGKGEEKKREEKRFNTQKIKLKSEIYIHERTDKYYMLPSIMITKLVTKRKHARTVPTFERDKTESYR